MKNKNIAYIWDMINAIQQIQEFTKNITYQEYQNSSLIKSAVERQFEILGEASRRLSLEFTESNSQIEWKDIIGLRNIIAHQYEKVNPKTLWNIIIKLQPLKEKLQFLLSSWSET
jgi:uncharacterized protein with HEPN domain